MVSNPLAVGVNCPSVFAPVVMAGSSFEKCYELGMKEGGYMEQEVIKICQSYLPDLQILCLIFCCCKNNPAPSASGKTNQYQQCVQNTLDAADNVMGGSSRFKAEMPYNMTTSPPTPITSRLPGRERFPSRNWTHNPELYGLPIPYTAGQGMVRRPDVVVVRDRSKPATVDNISRIVEMKFPGDPVNDIQLDTYRGISPNVSLIDGKNQNCDCEEEERKFRDAALKSLLMSILMSLFGRGMRGGRIPVPGRMPSPVGGGVPSPGVI